MASTVCIINGTVRLCTVTQHDIITRIADSPICDNNQRGAPHIPMITGGQCQKGESYKILYPLGTHPITQWLYGY